MIPCKNRHYGCPRMFSKTYGLQIHLRSCIHKTRRSDKLKKNVSISSNELDLIQQRLRCDMETFRNVPQDIVQSPLDINIVHVVAESTLMNEQNVIDSSYCSEDSKISHAKILMLRLARLCRKTGKRDITEVINILTSSEFCIEDFRKKCTKVDDCLSHEQHVSRVKLKGLGFRVVTISDPHTGIHCDLYVRSVVDILRKQVAEYCTYSAVFNSPCTGGSPEEYCHPMFAQLGSICVPIIQKHIMGSTNRGETWRNRNKCGEQSFVGLVQCHSDKSKTSLKESAFQFYPLHATLLNFSEAYRRRCISRGNTTVAFLPVSFYKIIDGERLIQGTDQARRLKLLHMSISYILEELKTTAYKGFNCLDSTGVKRVCHPCLASYCCDFPEGKDLTSVKNGNSSKRNCHRCQVLTKNFNTDSKGIPRNGTKECNIIIKAQVLRNEGKIKEAEDLLSDQSLVPQISSLAKFPFHDLHAMLDYHYMFCFEPLHNLHLGVSKDLKRCLSEMLRSVELISRSLPTKGGFSRVATFRTIRTTVLSGINSMLSHMQRVSPATNLRIDFSTSTKGVNGNGLYVEEGKLVGMLEAKHYRSVDMVSPFIGMFADRCCDEVSTAVTTSLFVSYAEIMQTSLSYSNSPVWYENKVKDLEKRIKAFKHLAVSLYGSCQTYRFCTENFHQLDHIGEDIRKFGGLRYGDEGLFESSHTDVKAAYRSGSKRKNCSMDETVVAYVKEKNKHLITETGERSHLGSSQAHHKSMSQARKQSIGDDCASAIKNRKAFALGELETGRKLVREIRVAREEKKQELFGQLKQKMGCVGDVVTQILDDVGEAGSRILYNELRSAQTATSEVIPPLHHNSKVIRVKSAYVSGIVAPTTKDFDKKSQEVRVQQSSSRTSQRIVATRGFYKSAHIRQDSVLIQAPSTARSQKTNLWVAKVLCLLRIPLNELPENSSHDDDLELAFVQFYDVQPLEDEIDRVLNCVKLKWSRGENGTLSTLSDENGNVSGCKWFSLLPISCIRGVVHVVRGDYGIEGRGVTKNMDSVPWENQIFYINRFYFNSSSKFLDHIDK